MDLSKRKKSESLQNSEFLKRLIHILSILCVTTSIGFASSLTGDDEKNKVAGDDKKGKVKRDDTTTYVVNEETIEDHADTTLMLFPSHDLYSVWDTTSAHPYKFYESFKGDSVELTLVNQGDNPFVMPFPGGITSQFGWRRYRPHYGTDIDLETGDQVVSCFDGMVLRLTPSEESEVSFIVF